jgi:hypothetical protein
VDWFCLRAKLRVSRWFCRRPAPRASALLVIGWVAGSHALAACADPTTELHVPTPDAQSFEQTVYPILLRDCGFPGECHGNPERFFHVYGPGRMRARPETKINMPVTGEELTATYRRARSMLAHEGSDVTDCLLLNKPLDAAHEGRDEWGYNVYRSANDPSYQTLLGWARSMLPASPAAQPDAAVIDAAPAFVPDAGVR